MCLCLSVHRLLMTEDTSNSRWVTDFSLKNCNWEIIKKSWKRDQAPAAYLSVCVCMCVRVCEEFFEIRWKVLTSTVILFYTHTPTVEHAVQIHTLTHTLLLSPSFSSPARRCSEETNHINSQLLFFLNCNAVNQSHSSLSFVLSHKHITDTGKNHTNHIKSKSLSLSHSHTHTHAHSSESDKTHANHII